ncbi:MAG: hypothetical protein ACOYL8_04630 [Patescibacteria group bacterium]
MNKTIKLLNEKTEVFFKKIGGKIIKIDVFNLTTFSSPDKKIPCFNYYIEFNSSNIFGSGSFSNNVYPRYRKMRTDWKKFLSESEIKNFNKIAFGFIPCLSNKITTYEAKYKLEKMILKNKIDSINKLSSEYFKKLKKTYDLRFCLKEKDGFLIGPEGGLLAAVDAAGKYFNSINNFVDIGAGTGELSAYIIKKYRVNKVIINEASYDLKDHLKSYLGEVSKIRKVDINFQFKDCRKIVLPKSSNIISLGVFYGFQPSFIKERGAEIKKILGENGVLIIQSAMPEAQFSYQVLMGRIAGLKKWPWYSNHVRIPSYFKYSRTFYIDNQFITLASQSRSTIGGILSNIRNNNCLGLELK